jgi:phosphate transport system substrate-binding protein
MRKILISLAIITLACAFVMQTAKVVCKIKGSDTCLPLSQKFAESFMKKNPGSSITVIGGGSGVGFSSLMSGTTDIAQASRSIKMDEKIKMKEAGKAFKEIIIAYDAISVVVNPANKLDALTREQLEGIFTGSITNWKEVGGNDMKIIVYSRESSSGTFEFFKEHVMKKKNYATSVLLMPATGAIIQSVSQTEGAIGYVGLAYVEKSVKAIKVSYDQGKNFVAPSIETAKNKTYPITRPLFYYFLNSTESGVKPLVDFILSDEGQEIVLKEGYVPLR